MLQAEDIGLLILIAVQAKIIQMKVSRKEAEQKKLIKHRKFVPSSLQLNNKNKNSDSSYVPDDYDAKSELTSLLYFSASKDKKPLLTPKPTNICKQNLRFFL